MRAIVGALNFHQAFRELERGFDRVIQAAPVLATHDQSVDDNGDVVVHPPIELGRVGYLDQLAIDDGAHETLFARGVEQLAEFSLATPHQRRQDLDLGSFRPLEDGVCDLTRALALDRSAAVRTVRCACASVQQSQIIVDLGDGPDRRAGIVTGRLLLDRDRRGQPLNGVDVRLLHEAEELPRVRRERLDVAALTLGVDRIEGERGFS